MKPDMSPQAITARLKLVSEITRTCLHLRKAQLETKKQESALSPDDTIGPYSKSRRKTDTDAI